MNVMPMIFLAIISLLDYLDNFRLQLWIASL
jgi:hypothetical protein